MDIKKLVHSNSNDDDANSSLENVDVVKNFMEFGNFNEESKQIQQKSCEPSGTVELVF